ncbi:MAG: TetR family transcriptional regulator [Desulfuromonas sp.]|nr:MAG: TetR family transcriptional regulator [Desulfuromonas sp.]
MAKKDKRTEILDAALVLFAENGFHGSPTSQLAQRAGVGVGTIYRYFSDKDELIRELYRDLKQKIGARIDESTPDLSMQERYVRMMTKFINYFVQHRNEFRFMEQYYFSPYSAEFDCSAPEENARIQQLLLAAREQGVVQDVSISVLQSLAFGPVIALVKENIYRDLDLDDEMIRQTVEATWTALEN